MRSRRTAGWAAAAALALAWAIAGPAAAGGWATVMIDHDTSATEGTAGEPIAIEFTVLQHGVTPVNSDEATVVATDAATGDVVRVAATPTGSGGIYRASLVLPHEGRWRWQVELGGLVAHSQLQDVAVAPAAAAPATASSAAAFDPLPALAVALVGGLLAVGALALAARLAGRRRDPEALSPR